MEGKKSLRRIRELLTLLVVDLIYNLIIDKWKKIPLQLVDEEEEVLVNNNTNGRDNIAIGYYYSPWRILVIVTIMLKIIW